MARGYGSLLRPQVSAWFLREIRRRSALRASAGWCTTLLLSYPRSGNHLVRQFMEYATGRPTLGEGDSERRLVPAALWDRPLYLRPGVELHVRDHAPIAVKRHGLQDLSSFDRLIWIVRDPIEVLIRSSEDLDDHAFSQWIPEEARAWKWQVRVFDAWCPERRLSLRFKGLASADPESFRQLADFIGVSDPEAVVRGFLEETWADSYEVLQDRPLSRGQASDYWQQSYPERASQVREALLAPEVLQPSRLSEWIDP